MGVVQKEIGEIGELFDVLPGVESVGEFLDFFRRESALFEDVGPQDGVHVVVGLEGFDDLLMEKHGWNGNKREGGRLLLF